MKPAFLITIDTEEDNQWTPGAHPTTENCRWLPRFQELCERHGFAVTYLTTYEMARSSEFKAFARGIIDRGAGEIGMHLHAWNSPPFRHLTADDNACHPFLTEFPVDVIFEKVTALTTVLQNTFQVKMTSHRAGRWAFNGSYARALIQNGYLVDCSVTPGLRWESGFGASRPEATIDYTGCSSPRPYFVDLEDIRFAGTTDLLEVPMSILDPWPQLGGIRQAPVLGKAVRHFFPSQVWLRPTGRNRTWMLAMLRRALTDGHSYAEFMLHSSELMPGGSPFFQDHRSIEALYRDLEAVLSFAALHFRSLTLSDFARYHQGLLSPFGEPVASAKR